MNEPLLIPFWIEGPEPRKILGYGVTAYSLKDALEIIAHAGYKLPKDTSKLTIHANIKVAEIEERHVRERMGPIVVRGLWYPFLGVGVGSTMTQLIWP